MKKTAKQEKDRNGPQAPQGKAYYNGTPYSIEAVMEQYEQSRLNQNLVEKYAYLPRETFLAVLYVLGRIR